MTIKLFGSKGIYKRYELLFGFMAGLLIYVIYMWLSGRVTYWNVFDPMPEYMMYRLKYFLIRLIGCGVLGIIIIMVKNYVIKTMNHKNLKVQ